MQLSKNIRKISWLAADKAVAVLYGIASVALLQVTDNKELGLFTLFNNLHNFILIFGSGLGTPPLLQFSANKAEIPLVNFYSLFNLAFVSIVITLIIFIFQTPLSGVLKEPHFIEIVSATPFLVLLSIPRYFFVGIFCREVALFKSFMLSLAYFGPMSVLIFYNIWCDNFLTSSDIIHINYIGGALSAVVGIFLSLKYLRFALPKFSKISKTATIKYKDILTFSLKYSFAALIAAVPKLFDVYFIQFFFGTGAVGIYSPAKTIFRFVEDIMTAVSGNIHSAAVKCFSVNDIPGVNSICSKSISILTLLFAGIALCTWLMGDYFFHLFLPERFINAMPIIKVLMLSSVVLPMIILQTVLAANGMMKSIAKYAIVAALGWLVAFFVIGNLNALPAQFMALPYIVFMLTFTSQLLVHSNKHYNLRFAQLFRIIPDTYSFIQSKIKKRAHN